MRANEMHLVVGSLQRRKVGKAVPVERLKSI